MGYINTFIINQIPFIIGYVLIHIRTEFDINYNQGKTQFQSMRFRQVSIQYFKFQTKHFSSLRFGTDVYFVSELSKWTFFVQWVSEIVLNDPLTVNGLFSIFSLFLSLPLYLPSLPTLLPITADPLPIHHRQFLRCCRHTVVALLSSPHQTEREKGTFPDPKQKRETSLSLPSN